MKVLKSPFFLSNDATCRVSAQDYWDKVSDSIQWTVETNNTLVYKEDSRMWRLNLKLRGLWGAAYKHCYTVSLDGMTSPLK